MRQEVKDYCSIDLFIFMNEEKNRKIHERRLKRKLNGLCRECNNFIDFLRSKYLCSYHLDKNKTFDRKRSEQHYFFDECHDCGIKLDNNSTTLYCVKCADKRNNRGISRFEKRKLENKCIRCVEQLDGDSKWHCISCLKKIEIKRKLKEQKRKENKECISCKKKETELFSFRCEICYLKTIACANLKNTSLWVELLSLFKKQNGKCVLSGRTLKFANNASVDHIIPLSKGGTHVIENLRWIDLTVNVMRSNMTDEELLTFCKEIIHYHEFQSSI